ncbi:hypothetical protein CJ739_2028 [Mariniflexile rhizosphaerae]|nr:hypothetical protein CJ739_2028 [Mariniflexile sp. TRM1-10]
MPNSKNNEPFIDFLTKTSRGFVRVLFDIPSRILRETPYFTKKPRTILEGMSKEALIRAVDSNFNSYFCEDYFSCYLQIAIAKMNAFGFNSFIRCG